MPSAHYAEDTLLLLIASASNVEREKISLTCELP